MPYHPRLPGQQVAEQKNVPRASKLKCFGLLHGKTAGAESIHAKFKGRTIQQPPYSVPDKVQQLVLNVKASVAPQNVAATLLPTGPKRIQQ